MGRGNRCTILLKWADALILLLVIMTISCMLSFSSGLIATEFGGSISEGVAKASASIPNPGLLSRASGTMVDGSRGFGDATTGSNIMGPLNHWTNVTLGYSRVSGAAALSTPEILKLSTQAKFVFRMLPGSSDGMF